MAYTFELQVFQKLSNNAHH